MLVGQSTKDSPDVCAKVDTVLSVVPVFEKTHPGAGSEKNTCKDWRTLAFFDGDKDMLRPAQRMVLATAPAREKKTGGN